MCVYCMIARRARTRVLTCAFRECSSVFASMYVRVCVGVCMCVCVYASPSVCVCVRLCMCARMYVYVCASVCVGCLYTYAQLFKFQRRSVSCRIGSCGAIGGAPFASVRVAPGFLPRRPCHPCHAVRAIHVGPYILALRVIRAGLWPAEGGAGTDDTQGLKVRPGAGDVSRAALMTRMARKKARHAQRGPNSGLA